MKIKASKLVISAIIFCAAGNCYADKSTSILSKAVIADKYVSYVGIKFAIVNVKGQMINTKARVFHMKPDKTRTEYIFPSSVAGTVIIRNSNNVWQYDVRSKMWEYFTEEKKLDLTDFENGIKDNYHTNLEKSRKIASQDAYIINITSVDNNRFTRKLFIDEKHFLIVGSDIRDVEGNLRSSSRFIKIDFSPDNLDPSLFVADGKVIQNCKKIKVDFSVVKPAFLPNGFKLVKSKGILMRGKLCSHLKYSDGINNFSLFQLKLTDKKGPAVLKKIGDMVIYSKNGWEFTLVGDLSPEMLKKIAMSIRI